MRCKQFGRLTLMSGLLVMSMTVMSGRSFADGLQSSLYDVDTYWTNYWDWYDTEYQMANELRARPYVGRYNSYLGASPAISTPDGGGDFDDHSIYFYFPDGASEWYGSKFGGPVPRETNINNIPREPGPAPGERPTRGRLVPQERPTVDQRSDAVDAGESNTPARRPARSQQNSREDDVWY